MATKTRIQRRLQFREEALAQLYDAYESLASGGVKQYAIGDRQLTKFDLPALKQEILDMEREIDELSVQLNNQKPRKAFGIIPRDL